MFGSEFSKHPEILLDSFSDMSHEYKKKTKKQKKENVIYELQKIYIALFGIPEIGFQVRSLFFKSIIENKIKKKVYKILDAGSGIGTYSFWMGKKHSDVKVIGIEVDKNKLDFSNKFSQELGLKNVKFQYGDVTKAFSKEKYDLIINIDVLEHVKDYKKVLKNFYLALAPKGYLYIHTPQPNQKRLFKALEKWHHEDHVREGFRPEELKRELKKLGMVIIETRETFGFFGKLAWELNHLVLSKGFVLSGITYPFLYVLIQLDTMTKNKDGLGTAILARKRTRS